MLIATLVLAVWVLCKRSAASTAKVYGLLEVERETCNRSHPDAGSSLKAFRTVLLVPAANL